jgi:hypothetical protein
MLNKIFFILLYFLFGTYNFAYSKVIFEPHPYTNLMTIRIEGEIKSSDLDDFKSAIKQLEVSKKKLHMNSVVLNSYGGNGTVAREIGEIIRAKKLNTYLAQDSRCESACVSILISGVQRYAFGRVGVHRTTYSRDIKDDSRVEKDINESLKVTSDYIKRMGVSMMLDDAINTTVSWKMRQLTETEKNQWNIFGFDRLAEEIYFNQTARERDMPRKEFITIFKSNYEDCLEEALKFKETIFDCARTKNLKPPSYYIQFLRWLDKKMDLYIRTESNGS